MYQIKSCLVMHREMVRDTNGWFNALKNTLYQAPDVILISDREAMELALAFAEIGHLGMANLHANSINQAFDRIINFFPKERHAQLHMNLSLNLRALASQPFVSKVGDGCSVAVETPLNSPLISDLILRGETGMVKEIMAKSTEQSMQIFDQALFQLCEDGIIFEEDALRNADPLTELRLHFKLKSKSAGAKSTSILALHEESKEEKVTEVQTGI
jgi:twitching motility protein PilU